MKLNRNIAQILAIVVFCLKMAFVYCFFKIAIWMGNKPSDIINFSGFVLFILLIWLIVSKAKNAILSLIKPFKKEK